MFEYGFELITMSVTSDIVRLLLIKHALIELIGSPAQCFFLFILSSSIPNSSLPLIMIHAEESA